MPPPLVTLVGWIFDVLGTPRLVYSIPFIRRNLEPDVDALGGPQWWCSTSLEPGQDSTPQQGPLTNTDNGLALRITKTPGANKVVVMCGISPVPPPLRHFTLVAHFIIPGERGDSIGPSEDGDRWAASLVARNGHTLNDVNDIHVGATHQVLNGMILLGTGEAQNPMPGPINEQESPADAYKAAIRRFTLETDIDCHTGQGKARLSTDSHTWTERTFTHPFIAGADTIQSPLTMIGVGLAMGLGSGTPFVVATDFSIYAWDRQVSSWWQPVVAALFRYRQHADWKRFHRPAEEAAMQPTAAISPRINV